MNRLRVPYYNLDSDSPFRNDTYFFYIEVRTQTVNDSMIMVKYRILFIGIIVNLLQHKCCTTDGFAVARNAKLLCQGPTEHQNDIDRFVLYKTLSDDDNDSSGSSDSGSSSSSSAFEEMRQLLENAWNIPTMGRIPTTPENAVDECVDAMQRLIQQNVNEKVQSNIYFIDILLPQYDISYGDKVYDEIYTAEFCIQFIQQLQIPTVIVYKDQAIVNTISRILNARSVTKSSDKSEEQPVAIDRPLEYDDFEEMESMQKDDLSIADFRKSLMQTWDTSPSTVDSGNTRIPDEEKIEQEEKKREIDIIAGTRQQQKLYYRIGSLFGNATISKGADMIEDVMRAVQMNDGLPYDHEQMMVIISPISKEEMYAIRAIVNKYNEVKSRKVTIVLFNCKLQPMPQEIMRGQTIYSILPLIGKKKDASLSTATGSLVQPKVVVLCRYPYDWQVHVDLGIIANGGFECIASIPVRDVQLLRSSTSRGPSMEWIQSVVQRYMQQQSPPPKLE